jgi:hypothetical protein
MVTDMVTDGSIGWEGLCNLPNVFDHLDMIDTCL